MSGTSFARRKAEGIYAQSPEISAVDLAKISGVSARTARRVKKEWLRANGIKYRLDVDYNPEGIFFPHSGGVHVAENTALRCVAFLPDLHCPYDDRQAVDIAVEYIHQHHAPTDLILGGDFADLFEMSKFPSTPRMHPDEEVAAVVRRLEDMSAAFPDCRKVYLMGNHERRMIRYIQTEAPKMARILGPTIPAIFQLERLGYEFHDNRETWESRGEFLKIGKLIYCHGDELPGASGKYAPLRVAEVHRQNIIYGHLHKQDASPPVRDLSGHVIKVWQVGCLHTKTPHYLPGANHSLGFAVIEYDSNNQDFTVYNYIIDDNWRVRL